MNKVMIGVGLLAVAAAVAGCTKRNESLVASESASATASASANMGDAVAKDIHDKLDKAKAAGKAVEDAGKAQEEKVKQATEDAAKAAEGK
jgi:hypothetical protein